MECVHPKEQPERHSTTFHTNCILYRENPEQVIFKLYLARVQLVSACVPEVTSMQVFECIGEEWKYSRYPCLRFVYLGSSRAVIGHLFSRGEGSRFG
jgi:hypothetical protein